MGVYNTFISCYVRLGAIDKIEETLKLMEAQSVQPDRRTFMPILTSYTRKLDIENSKYWFNRMKNSLRGDIDRFAYILMERLHKNIGDHKAAESYAKTLGTHFGV